MSETVPVPNRSFLWVTIYILIYFWCFIGGYISPSDGSSDVPLHIENGCLAVLAWTIKTSLVIVICIYYSESESILNGTLNAKYISYIGSNHIYFKIKQNMSAVNTCLDSGYTQHHRPRNTGRRGGGVGVLINNQINVKSRIVCVNPEITSFESMELVLTISSITIRCSAIYCMPSVKSKNGLKQDTLCNSMTISRNCHVLMVILL